ncbi:MAG: hypothetical protein MPW14_17685 [Candidatus Manganitrophus sp.]|nr:MAG: hypothetical protein MPW14_17685 [Candidatus Manganitrophus sp.]
MMPQKKNPDVLELIRGKTGRVNGSLLALLTLLKGLPLAYNQDHQEDKEPLFNTVDTVQKRLVRAYWPTWCRQVTFRTQERMLEAPQLRGFASATDLADYLVPKGLPFRQAHKVAGKIVRRSLEEGRPMEGWTLAELQTFSPLFAGDVFECFSLTGSLQRKGGSAGPLPNRSKPKSER